MITILNSLNRFTTLILLLIGCGAFSPYVEAQLSRRSPAVREVRFDSGNEAHGIPFELHNNHIYLRVGVNNSEPLLFILDTGASSLISRQRVESLGLKLRQAGRGYGVGENLIEASTVEGVSLRLHGVTLSRQSLASMPLESLQASLGRPVDGILGYSFFHRFVVEVNYAAHVINLYSPGGYRYRGRGERIALIIDEDSELIFARAQVKPSNRAPLTGLFEIDSGGGHALILNRPFVERHNLLPDALQAKPISLGGIVGSSSAVEGVVDSLRLGRSRVENVSTFFSLAKEGMLASDEFSGNIGNDVLRRFKVIFDYSRRLMVLESNS